MFTASRARSLASLLFVPLWLAGSAGAAPGPARDRAVAFAADVAAEGGRTKLRILLSRKIEANTFVLEHPDRVVIEWPDVNCQVGDGGRSKQRTGAVAGYRCGLASPSRTRLVVDLATPATVAKAETVPGPLPDMAVLTVELVRAERDAFRRNAARDAADLALTTGSLPPGDRSVDRRPLIAIDAGHGGVDPGATAPTGAVEKDLTLAFAETLRQRLAASGRYRLMLTRDRDVYVPLDERVRRARDQKADLFLSIHADSITSPHVGGATLYTGAERASDTESEDLALRENAADATDGFGGPESAGGVSDILRDLRLRETRGFSHRASNNLFRDLGPAIRFSAQPQREAGFRVLRDPDLPSVLVELGYLSNTHDLELMSQDAWRSRVAASMVGALDRYFEPRLAARAAMSP